MYRKMDRNDSGYAVVLMTFLSTEALNVQEFIHSNSSRRRYQHRQPHIFAVKRLKDIDNHCVSLTQMQANSPYSSSRRANWSPSSAQANCLPPVNNWPYGTESIAIHCVSWKSDTQWMFCEVYPRLATRSSKEQEGCWVQTRAGEEVSSLYSLTIAERWQLAKIDEPHMALQICFVS
jgi:hypothetical protein